MEATAQYWGDAMLNSRGLFPNAWQGEVAAARARQGLARALAPSQSNRFVNKPAHLLGAFSRSSCGNEPPRYCRKRGSGRRLMHLLRRAIAERLVWPPSIVAFKPRIQPGAQLRQRAVIAQVDFRVLEAAPEPLDEDVVHPAPLAVHAHGDAELLQAPGLFLARELAALVGVEDLRHAVAVGSHGVGERPETEPHIHRVGEAPAQDLARGQGLSPYRALAA